MSIPSLTISPAGAAQAYARVAGGGSSEEGFGSALGQALQGVVQAGHDADTQAMKAISGAGNFTDVAVAVSHAELSLQSAVAIRDRVVQAYQDVMRMAI